MKSYDVVVIGAGIVGLATAMQLLIEQPHLKVAVLDKEKRVAAHQTGHNSGVIHSGIYYKPGSLKAQNCIKGVRELKEFCIKQKIPFETCGKVIVATHPEELPRLEELYRRGVANGVEGLEIIDSKRLSEIEPHAGGILALYSPNTAIIDFTLVAETYAKVIRELGGEIFLSQKVLKIENQQIITEDQEYKTNWIINCAGVHADRVAHMTEKKVNPKQIIPFRGEYYELRPEKRSMIKGLIYPVPDPKFPFLGVHLSRTVGGGVEAGPNAVLAFSREGYKKTDINFKDCVDFLTYKGFWAMAARYWKIGAYEIYRSYSKKAFLIALQRLVPDLKSDDLVPTEAGVRSQVVLPDGRMQDDFSIIKQPGIIHVLNAPSPAATASLSIGRHIASYIK